VEHKRDLTVKAHSSFEKVSEILKDRVCPGSKRTLGSYHKTHKGARPKTYWVAIPGVHRNLESRQGYLQC